MSWQSFLVAILPIVLIGIYIYRKDKVKESGHLLFKLFMGGILSCFPAVTLELFFGKFFPEMEYMNFIQLFLYVFLVIALVEEFCKWFFLYRISYNNDEFDSLYDMIVYASFVALGFACLENILYVASSGIVTGIFRAISAVPGHVCDGILMGSYLSLAKYNYVKGNKKLSNKYKVLSIIIPTVAHGIYDFCLFSENIIFIIIFLIFVLYLFTICIKKVKDISNNNIKFNNMNYSYCSNCGSLVSGNYCRKCGSKIKTRISFEK